MELLLLLLVLRRRVLETKQNLFSSQQNKRLTTCKVTLADQAHWKVNEIFKKLLSIATPCKNFLPSPSLVVSLPRFNPSQNWKLYYHGIPPSETLKSVVMWRQVGRKSSTNMFQKEDTSSNWDSVVSFVLPAGTSRSIV